MNQENKLFILKNKLEHLLNQLEDKKYELHTYLKESELQINTIKNQLQLLNNHLYEKEESKIEEIQDNQQDDQDEDDQDDYDEEEDEDDDIEGRIMANIDPNLARLLGMEVENVQEETKSNWVPPSFSGLHNSQRNSIYDHMYKK
jgi:hypothetical protein